MTIIHVGRRNRACQYDGTNSAEMLTLYQSWFATYGYVGTIGSANGSQVSINEYEADGVTLRGSYQILLSSWAVYNQDENNMASYTNTQLAFRYVQMQEYAGYLLATDAFKTAIAAAASGFGSIPSITVNGLSNANFEIPIRPMQPSNAFTATPFLTGSSSLLGSLSITGLTSGTVPNANKLTTVIGGVTWYDRVRVNVANSGALQLAGAALLAHVTP